MIARGLLVAAIIVALFGAPTAVFAAGNELSSPLASPGSGSTSTNFTFTVKYDGKFAATKVTASVAGRALTMVRVGGSSTSGTWSASSTLAAGTWPVTFSAVAERGNTPTLIGPNVTVGAATTATPEPTPAPTPAPTPKPPPGGSTGTTTTTSRGEALAGVSATIDSDEDAIPATDGVLNVVLLVGLSGVAAVALIGVAMMLAAHRRDGKDETTVPATASVAAAATGSSPDGTPNTVMERRMLRQARVRMTDDPIVAALGIGNDEDDRRRARRKAGQVGRGPGERPNVGRN